MRSLTLLAVIFVLGQAVSAQPYQQPYMQRFQQYAPQYNQQQYSPYFPEQQQANPSQPGMSSLPAGQYTLTNNGTGQAMSVTVTPQGQMYTGAASSSPVQPSQSVEQPKSKFGFLKGILQEGLGAASSMGY